MKITRKKIGLTVVGDYTISTVLIPWGDDYETKVFTNIAWQTRTDMREIEMARYGTEGEAQEGHAAMVAKWTVTMEEV